MNRRFFMGTLGTVGGNLIGATPVQASDQLSENEFSAILIDTTRCAGCRNCELMCAEANELQEPNLEDETVLDRQRKTDENAFTVVNSFEVEDEIISTKRQCFHCSQPACAAACLTKAMIKTKEGPVIWREDKCMGCRFCMVSCPFDIPKFEYHSSLPRIRKCNMCWSRLQKGSQPACVEGCPSEALAFGSRRELLEIARARIYEEPDTYYHHIYGEHEAGGTCVLYLSSIPFEDIGFKAGIGTSSYPELTKDFLYGVPVVLTLWPAFLLALSQATKRDKNQEEKDPIHGTQ